MWITSDVNLPDELLNAQEDGHLVIFAGAGVSKGPPSNLPNFDSLAERVSGGGLSRDRREPVDRFLGRLAKQGTDVQVIVCDIIGSPASNPTPLHRHLLTLFVSRSSLRLVTTNFDRHFSTTADDLFGSTIDTYYAPALPIGDDFTGIVYLHGSIDKDCKRLVLTDRDFGRAYLTKGWATRFLREMFERYVVLFVGYSHNDPVMHYMARALEGDSSRFAFTTEKQVDHWRDLGIKPIVYPLIRGWNRHRALTHCMESWAQLTKMGTLDHERRISEITAASVHVDRLDTDYINGCLADPVRVRLFMRHACSLDWLRWMEDNPAFLELFQTNRPVDDQASHLAYWFSDSFVCKHPGQALLVVQRNGEKMNPALWQSIASAIAIHWEELNSETRSKWVSILVDRAYPGCNDPHQLNHILSKCRADDLNSALMLFELITRPRLKLTPDYSCYLRGQSEPNDVSAEVVIGGEVHWLRGVWDNLLKPNLAEIYQYVEPLLTANLVRGHLFLRAHDSTSQDADSTSYARSAIEPHRQDPFPRGLDVLIDAARDTLEWLVRNRHEQAMSVIEQWADSDVPILKRLAIHGVTESPDMMPDVKLEWLLHKKWLYSRGMKHEVFRLMAVAFPNASRIAREGLLNAALLGPAQEEDKEHDEEYRHRRILNLLSWLHKASPGYELVTDSLGIIKQSYPSLEPDEHPDSNAWLYSELTVERGPVSVEELLSMKPAEHLDWLLTYQGGGFQEADRDDLLFRIVEAAEKSFDWGWRLSCALETRERWEADLWDSIFRGWTKSVIEHNHWDSVLNLLDTHPQLLKFSDPLARLLENGSSREDGGIPIDSLALAENIAARLWDMCVGEGPPVERSGNEDWLDKAINHSGGRITLFWLHAISKRRAAQEEGRELNCSPYLDRFQGVVAGKSLPEQMGLIILASQIHFLYVIDPVWTKDNLLPLFNWSGDADRAAQAWHGFLIWGRWNQAFLHDILPLYLQSITKESICNHATLRDRLCGHLASIAIFGSNDPVAEKWLYQFLLAVTEEMHIIWARQFGHQLGSLKEDQIRSLWERWLRKYWESRINGVPVALSDNEKKEMVPWVLPLLPAFSEVVDLISRMGAPNIPESFLYGELRDKEIATTFPNESVRLLEELLSQAREPFWGYSEVSDIFRELVSNGAPTDGLQTICENLARLGFSQASELSALVPKGQ